MKMEKAPWEVGRDGLVRERGDKKDAFLREMWVEKLG